MMENLISIPSLLRTASATSSSSPLSEWDTVNVTGVAGAASIPLPLPTAGSTEGLVGEDEDEESNEEDNEGDEEDSDGSDEDSEDNNDGNGNNDNEEDGNNGGGGNSDGDDDGNNFFGGDSFFD